jgi:initiation factor 1A
MVKNLGGNKAKRQGRKHTQGDTSHTTRRASAEDEKYGIITKVYGNGRAEVKCIDGVFRLLIIRKKFKGRNKRDNTVSLNCWVLAGLRSWEVRRADDRENCDLLEVYNSGDVEELKQSVDAPWTVLTSASKSNDDSSGAVEDVNFVDERTQKYEDLLDSNQNGETVQESLDWLAEDGSEESDFDIDDL